MHQIQDDHQDYKALTTGLARMARVLLAQDSVQDTLDRIVEHAVTLVPGCEAAGILALHRREVVTLAATDDLARAADRDQGELAEGPCLEVAVERTPVYRISDLERERDRWPRFAERARKHGIGSMMGFLLYTTDADNLGALNLYSARPDAFDEPAEHAGWVLASHAAVGLAAARHNQNLEYALSTSRLIGEAVGVVMSRYRLSEEHAFDRIRRASQHSNLKVRDLAQTIVRIGEIPEPGTSGW